MFDSTMRSGGKYCVFLFLLKSVLSDPGASNQGELVKGVFVFPDIHDHLPGSEAFLFFGGISFTIKKTWFWIACSPHQTRESTLKYPICRQPYRILVITVGRFCHNLDQDMGNIISFYFTVAIRCKLYSIQNHIQSTWVIYRKPSPSDSRYVFVLITQDTPE